MVTVRCADRQNVAPGFRGCLRILLAALLCATVLLMPAPTFADTLSPPAEGPRWSLAPADDAGPDGRRSIDHELNPGDTLDEQVVLTNLSAEETTFHLAAADGYYTRAGRFDTLADGQPSTALGSWITVADTVSVAGGASVVVPLTVVIPQQVEPGDYVAGVTASILTRQSSADGTSVGVESRVGVRVSIRVRGTLTASATVSDVGGAFATAWNPFRPGSAAISFAVTNTGNTRLLLRGAVSTGGDTVSFPAENETAQELLPGDTQSVTVAVPAMWPTFFVPVEVALSPEVISMQGTPPPIDVVSATGVVWAPPVPQLVLLAGLAAVIAALLWRRRRAQRHLSALLERAREEGRNDARSTA